MEQVCFNAPEYIIAALTGLVTIASVVANFVSKDTVVGKIVHYIAINFRR